MLTLNLVCEELVLSIANYLEITKTITSFS